MTETAEKPVPEKAKRKPKGTAPEPEREYLVFEVKATTADGWVADSRGGTTPATEDEPLPQTVYVLLGAHKGNTDREAIKAAIGEQEGSFVGIPKRFVRVHTRARKQVVEDVWS